jgi:hypothetical protein
MDIAVTATQLLIPMIESRGDIWMLDHIDQRAERAGGAARERACRGVRGAKPLGTR